MTVRPSARTARAQVAAPAPVAPPPADTPALDRTRSIALAREEKAIAQKYMGGPLWGVTAFAVGGFALWVALFPLVMLDLLPLWAGCILSTVLATGGYVTSHEAQHGNIARPGERLRWVNELVGHISTFPIIFPYRMARIMHLQHHYHCNDPRHDPDYPDRADSAFKAVLRTIVNRQHGSGGSIHHYKRVLAELDSPAARAAQRDTVLMQLACMAFFFAMAWGGYPLEILFLWWLPRHVALSYIRFYLSWAPHHPREGRTRYTNTRAFRSRLGHILSMGMQYHVVHHLYPNIPTHRTKAAYWEMRHILAERGVELGRL